MKFLVENDTIRFQNISTFIRKLSISFLLEKFENIRVIHI